MATKHSNEKERKIFDAAYMILAEKGYAGASMLAIAKRAKASNETLYKWYGDKNGLFAAMIDANAADVRALLTETEGTPEDTLEKLAPMLLSLLLSDRAITLNRAAAADPTGALGTTLTKRGRGKIGPMIAKHLEAARDDGTLAFENTPATLALFLDLLVGDLQIRRAIGALPQPSKDEIETRADKALTNLRRLLRNS